MNKLHVYGYDFHAERGHGPDKVTIEGRITLRAKNLEKFFDSNILIIDECFTNHDFQITSAGRFFAAEEEDHGTEPLN